MSKVSEYKVKFRYKDSVYYQPLTKCKRFVERDKPLYRGLKQIICALHELNAKEVEIVAVMKGRDFT